MIHIFIFQGTTRDTARDKSGKPETECGDGELVN